MHFKFILMQCAISIDFFFSFSTAFSGSLYMWLCIHCFSFVTASRHSIVCLYPVFPQLLLQGWNSAFTNNMVHDAAWELLWNIFPGMMLLGYRTYACLITPKATRLLSRRAVPVKTPTSHAQEKVPKCHILDSTWHYLPPPPSLTLHYKWCSSSSVSGFLWKNQMCSRMKDTAQKAADAFRCSRWRQRAPR